MRQAIKAPGKTFKAGRVQYTFVRELMGGTLLCELPGGHFISYPRARIEFVDSEHGGNYEITALKANWKPKAGDMEWPRFKVWGGLAAENVTQAVCAALLREALRQLDDVVLHCHDEIALETSVKKADTRGKHLQHVMENPAPWADGLPLEAPYEVMHRYGKP
jgi:DNA polymerase